MNGDKGLNLDLLRINIDFGFMIVVSLCSYQERVLTGISIKI